MPSHYLNQCWFFVNWTLDNKFYWNLYENKQIIIQENAFESVVCKRAATLTWSHRGLVISEKYFTYLCIFRAAAVDRLLVMSNNNAYQFMRTLAPAMPWGHHVNFSEYNFSIYHLACTCICAKLGIPMLKIRRSHDRLIFNMGIPNFNETQIETKVVTNGSVYSKKCNW